jgi:Fe-S oxidoreductase
MLEGNPLETGWRDESVKEALDLCLACKGCRGECPVNVDMATYKAEFLAHYFKGRLRPVHAYAFGLMQWWARASAWMPGVVNFFTQTPGLRNMAKAVVGMAPERSIPKFAPQTFRAWFHGRAVANHGLTQVLLWPDTWNNHFHPSTAQAAVDVLEAAGFQVVIPAKLLCCGRPLYDYGMLHLAKRQLRQILDALGPQIRAGMCVVGLEPSCVSVFRDELVNMLPGDADARRLSQQTYLLSEFLAQKAPNFEIPPLRAKAVVHGHCHQKAVLKFGDEETLLKKLGLDYTVLDSGCCGMAGAFGFEKGDHYDVSIACGERVLLPQVRGAALDTLIVSNGFSCREQIAQTTNRQAMHIAQVLKMALDHRAPHPRPELAYMPDVEHASAAAHV